MYGWVFGVCVRVDVDALVRVPVCVCKHAA